MPTIDEKRVYDDHAGAETVLVATGVGLATVSVSDDLVGEFALAHRCDARDVATRGGEAAVATADALLAGPVDDLAATGFGPAVAVGVDGDALLAAGPDGRVARRPAARDGGSGTDGAWADLGTADGTVHAIDGDLVAAEGGVYRATDGGLRHAGLTHVRDVSAPGVPHAATDDGLYRLGNGWQAVTDGAFRVVAARGTSDATDADARLADGAGVERGRPGTAHAATRETLFARQDGDWTPVDLPASGPVADVAYGVGTYVVTESGTLQVTVGDGWRSRSLGLPGVGGMAVL